jgi:hypothetical protein
VPIVFVQVPDPVGAGFVESLPRPGGNTRSDGVRRRAGKYSHYRISEMRH